MLRHELAVVGTGNFALYAKADLALQYWQLSLRPSWVSRIY